MASNPPDARAGTECAGLLTLRRATQDNMLFVLYSTPITSKLVWAPISLMPLGFHLKEVDWTGVNTRCSVIIYEECLAVINSACHTK
eukprot:804671-Pelagomonas_calceolata.AAC.3